MLSIRLHAFVAVGLSDCPNPAPAAQHRPGAPGRARDRAPGRRGAAHELHRLLPCSDPVETMAQGDGPRQAVEIDGEAYWDGGYAGNPTITPLVNECTSNDTILVQINPVERPGTPRTAREIVNRVNEISFDSSLLKELRMIAVLRQVANPGRCEGALWAKMRIHRIASEAMTELGYSSKLNAEWDILCHLRDKGRQAANAFLELHGQDLGAQSSVDLNALLAGKS